MSKVIGKEQVMKSFAELRKNIRTKALRTGVTKAARKIARDVKARAPRETGLLARSLGQKVKTYPNGNVVGIIGPRRGFKRQVLINKKGKLATVKVGQSKRGFSALKNARGGNVFRVPTKYAHLVEFGTARNPAKPFLRPALEGNREVFLKEITDAIQTAIVEASR